MSFNRNAGSVAERAMQKIEPGLKDSYAAMIRFLAKHPDFAKKMRSLEIGTATYINKQASAFRDSRLLKIPRRPNTVPDEMVSFILVKHFGVPQKRIEKAREVHGISMAAENLVGELLERYLASVLEPGGWVWCSGSTVKSIDFIKPPANSRGNWLALQVKNRDNSENSSSSAIRHGTDIKKWHRTFSKRPGSNWADFPDEKLRRKLSENGFRSFVQRYLNKVKRAST